MVAVTLETNSTSKHSHNEHAPHLDDCDYGSFCGLAAAVTHNLIVQIYVCGTHTSMTPIARSFRIWCEKWPLFNDRTQFEIQLRRPRGVARLRHKRQKTWADLHFHKPPPRLSVLRAYTQQSRAFRRIESPPRSRSVCVWLFGISVAVASVFRI